MFDLNQLNVSIAKHSRLHPQPGRKKRVLDKHKIHRSIVPTFVTRRQTPTAQDVALHALVCLLRAVEVDVCGRSNTDGLDMVSGVPCIDEGREGQAAVMEEGVLSLVLRACSVFQNQADVVKACCMLMRVSVQCSLRGGWAQVRTSEGRSVLLNLRPHRKKPIMCVCEGAAVLSIYPLGSIALNHTKR